MWWKLCENRIVTGIGRLFAAFGIPVMLMLIGWFFSQFDTMRSRLDVVQTRQDTIINRIDKIEDLLIDHISSNKEK